MSKNFIKAVSTLSGTIIGVGFFVLPYLMSKVGILVMSLYFMFLGTIVILIHQFFGELSLVTPDEKRMPGFAKIYLGSLGEKIAFFCAIFGFYGALLAYLILGGKFLENLFSPFFSSPSFFYYFLYFLFGAIFIYRGISLIWKAEFLGIILFFLILILILFFGKNYINFNYFSEIKFEMSNLFLPFGPILFSLWGASLIPEIEELLKEEKRLLKRVIFLSVLIPAILYFLFALIVFSICGKSTSQDALSGLENFLGQNLMPFLYFFGLITVFTSFIALGLTLKKVFWYDLKLDKNLAFFLTLFPPLFLFFLGVKEFLPVISFVGSVMLGFEGILILLMYYKRFKKEISKFKTFLLYSLIFVLTMGIFYEIIYFRH